MEIGKVTKYPIKIEPTSNYGFIVTVGCGSFAFGNKDALLTALREYLDNPAGYEKLYISTCSTPDAPQTARERDVSGESQDRQTTSRDAL